MAVISGRRSASIWAVTLSMAAPLQPLPSRGNNRLAATQASRRAMLMPWARTGPIGWAASPSSSRPGWHQRSASPTCTVSRLGAPNPPLHCRSQAASCGGLKAAIRSIHPSLLSSGVAFDLPTTQPSCKPPLALSKALKTPSGPTRVVKQPVKGEAAGLAS